MKMYRSERVKVWICVFVTRLMSLLQHRSMRISFNECYRKGETKQLDYGMPPSCLPADHQSLFLVKISALKVAED